MRQVSGSLVRMPIFWLLGNPTTRPKVFALAGCADRLQSLTTHSDVPHKFSVFAVAAMTRPVECASVFLYPHGAATESPSLFAHIVCHRCGRLRNAMEGSLPSPKVPMLNRRLALFERAIRSQKGEAK